MKIILVAAYYFISWIYHKLFNQTHIVKHLGLLLILSKTEYNEPACTHDLASRIVHCGQSKFHLYSLLSPILPLKDKNSCKT